MWMYTSTPLYVLPERLCCHKSVKLAAFCLRRSCDSHSGDYNEYCLLGV
jgi:hypothetical protein